MSEAGRGGAAVTERGQGKDRWVLLPLLCLAVTGHLLSTDSLCNFLAACQTSRKVHLGLGTLEAALFPLHPREVPTSSDLRRSDGTATHNRIKKNKKPRLS